VNFDDLLLLAKNYNAAGASVTWAMGDFNYDGDVNFDDLLILAKNYNKALPAPSDGTAVAADMAVAPVVTASTAAPTKPKPTAKPVSKKTAAPVPRATAVAPTTSFGKRRISGSGVLG